MKKVFCLLLAFLMCISLCACQKKEEVIELTTENIYDYLTFEKNTSGGAVEATSKNVFGLPVTTYSGKGTYRLEAFRKDNVGFKDVTIEIELIVGNGRTRKEWLFASGGKLAQEYSDDIGRYVKKVQMDVSFDGVGSVAEEMVLDVVLNAMDARLQLPPMSLSSYISYEIISVSGSVVVLS